MPMQHYRYSYDTVDIFQKLIDYYASSNINIWLAGLLLWSSPASPRKTPFMGDSRSKHQGILDPTQKQTFL